MNGELDMKEKCKEIAAQREKTEKRIIDGQIEDGNAVVAALYDRKQYPSKTAYD